MDEAALQAQGFQPYRKITVTYARRIPVRFSVAMNSGERLAGRPGDYICYSPSENNRWVVEQDIFQQTYTPLPQAEADRQQPPLPRSLLAQGYKPYIKHQITWALRLKQPRIVHTIEGDVRANAGDYLCVGPVGEQWPQTAARFEAAYRRVEGV